MSAIGRERNDRFCPVPIETDAPADAGQSDATVCCHWQYRTAEGQADAVTDAAATQSVPEQGEVELVSVRHAGGFRVALYHERLAHASR